MKTLTIYTIFILFSKILIAQQDQLIKQDTSYLFQRMKLSVHAGINHCMDPQLNNFFHSKSFFNYGIQFSFIKNRSSRFIPFLSLDRLNFRTDNYVINDVFFLLDNPQNYDTTLKINQLSFGFQTHFYKFKSNSAHSSNSFYSILSVGIGEFRITETEHNMIFNGLRLGFGLEHSITKKHLFSHSFEFIYDLNKPFLSNRSNNYLNYNNLRIRYLIGF